MNQLLKTKSIAAVIHWARNQRVMLDRDLARKIDSLEENSPQSFLSQSSALGKHSYRQN